MRTPLFPPPPPRKNGLVPGRRIHTGMRHAHTQPHMADEKVGRAGGVARTYETEKPQSRFVLLESSPEYYHTAAAEYTKKKHETSPHLTSPDQTKKKSIKNSFGVRPLPTADRKKKTPSNRTQIRGNRLHKKKSTIHTHKKRTL